MKTHDDFVADVAAVYAGDQTKGAFGSGRLIGLDLILTAGHVVDFPTREVPDRTGWRIVLIRERDTDGRWSAPAHEAEVIWRGKGALDLALLRVTDQKRLEPKLKPEFVSYARAGSIGQIDAAGFPQAWVHEAIAVRDYSVRGDLRIASQDGPYAWALQPSDRPDRPEGWRGMSGSAVCHLGSGDQLYLFGVVEEIPANFSGLLAVARISYAFEDPDFRRYLKAALGDDPRLAPFQVEQWRPDEINALAAVLPPYCGQYPRRTGSKFRNLSNFTWAQNSNPSPLGVGTKRWAN